MFRFSDNFAVTLFALLVCFFFFFRFLWSLLPLLFILSHSQFLSLSVFHCFCLLCCCIRCRLIFTKNSFVVSVFTCARCTLMTLSEKLYSIIPPIPKPFCIHKAIFYVWKCIRCFFCSVFLCPNHVFVPFQCSGVLASVLANKKRNWNRGIFQWKHFHNFHPQMLMTFP